MPVNDINIIGRNTRGVHIMSLDESALVAVKLLTKAWRRRQGEEVASDKQEDRDGRDSTELKETGGN